ncbi:IS110 family transposase [Enhydrobacter sp.]|jgi:transposase|uniref:IS110 family transposase n=1 Tax=Enhydrobacter sp. TaxID=1894999 RepID=UPI0026082F39|nr:IS110 family transposase [Enhydrobacter sp.]WIM09081.1 MAG: Mobile element protein [Enhydrobacter sp.]WIM09337.1 MAG: Mobile element protein [Enhydrobacter sp.]WIM09369.1 MAG: Mobile element protein [Enhydrobacter sp.]
MTQKRTLVGLDIAKGKIDAAIRSAGAEASFAHDAAGRRRLLEWLAEHGVATAVMEASGGYERSWAGLLREAGLAVVIVDPQRVRHFARSAGQRAKTDAIDARMIAWFGEVFEDLTGQARDEERQELDQLVTARLGMVRLKGQIESWNEHEQPKAVRKIHQALLEAVGAQLAKLEAVIAARIATVERFARQAEILHSVPGLGDAAVAGLIALLPELGRVDRQAAAALLGVAPFADDSGERRGQRHIQGGRRKLRTLLYMPILSAIQHNPVLKAHYQRLRARGKKPKVALIACMRKLIGILNTMLQRSQTWDPVKHAIA